MGSWDALLAGADAAVELLDLFGAHMGGFWEGEWEEKGERGGVLR
jgi:hypothetical protein